MIDSMSGGRLIAGFAMGGGPEAFNYDIPQPQARARYWEAIDLDPPRLDRGRAVPP